MTSLGNVKRRLAATYLIQNPQATLDAVNDFVVKMYGTGIRREALTRLRHAVMKKMDLPVPTNGPRFNPTLSRERSSFQVQPRLTAENYKYIKKVTVGRTISDVINEAVELHQKQKRVAVRKKR